MSDDMFDLLSKDLANAWDVIEHPHKHLLSLEHIKAMSCADIEWPTIVKSCAYEVYTNYKQTGDWNYE